MHRLTLPPNPEVKAGMGLAVMLGMIYLELELFSTIMPKLPVKELYF